MYEKIYEKVQIIPRGTIASYGSVARAAGLIRGARIVGWALRQLPADTPIPWHRVVNKKAELSIINPSIPASIQGELLEQEGLKIINTGHFFTIENPPWYDFTESV